MAQEECLDHVEEAQRELEEAFQVAGPELRAHVERALEVVEECVQACRAVVEEV